MATETTTYNGWKNHETWCVHLGLSFANYVGTAIDEPFVWYVFEEVSL